MSQSTKEDIEELQARCDYLESEYNELKKRFDGLIARLNEMIEINDLEFPP